MNRGDQKVVGEGWHRRWSPPVGSSYEIMPVLAAALVVQRWIAKCSEIDHSRNAAGMIIRLLKRGLKLMHGRVARRLIPQIFGHYFFVKGGSKLWFELV